MTTVTETSERHRLAAIPASYFRAVDSLDADAMLDHFAEDATLTVQTARVTFSSPRRSRVCSRTSSPTRISMVHDITDLLVEPGAGKVATEQHVDLVRNGTTKMHHCNFFDVNEDGRFSRVIIWMDGTNPLN